MTVGGPWPLSLSFSLQTLSPSLYWGGGSDRRTLALQSVLLKVTHVTDQSKVPLSDPDPGLVSADPIESHKLHPVT